MTVSHTDGCVEARFERMRKAAEQGMTNNVTYTNGGCVEAAFGRELPSFLYY